MKRTSSKSWREAGIRAPRSASSLSRVRMALFGRYSDDDAKKMFPEGWRSPKPYIRIVKQPAEDARVRLPQATRG